MNEAAVADLDRLRGRLYERVGGPHATTEVFDVFARETYTTAASEIMEVRAPQDELVASPVVVSVPHSGVLVPTRFADRFPHDESTLVEIDLFSHLLYEQLPVTQVVSRLAPYFLDVNRGRAAADERQVPRHLRNAPHDHLTVDDEPILRRSYTEAEEEDVLRWYDLYHDLLNALVTRARRRHGWTLLLDGHSMTSVGLRVAHDKGEARDNFVVGTLGGTSADEAIIEAFIGTLRREVKPYDLGLTVAENVPYSGGFITRKHHDPANELHALQLEVTMDSYMYEADEADPARRYGIKQHRLDIVREVLAKAVDAAVVAGAK